MSIYDRQQMNLVDTWIKMDQADYIVSIRLADVYWKYMQFGLTLLRLRLL